MNLLFTKMHGLGNDFVVIDATRAPFAPTPQLLARLTDRHFGVGCDQVLVVDPAPAGDVDFGYRIYNADGSESGQCLNGSRCVARFIRSHGLSTRRSIRVRTCNSTLQLELLDDDQVRVDAGAPRFEPVRIPFTGAPQAPLYKLELADGTPISFGAVSMGNPHAVIEVANVDSAPVAAVGAALQNHPAFPERVNVGFVQFIDAGHARLRVYERGAGETLACGSGACAAMAVGRLWGRLDAQAQIAVRGGKLELEWEWAMRVPDESSILMTGPAQTVFEGILKWGGEGNGEGESE